MLILRVLALILVVLAGYWAWRYDPVPPPRPLLYEKGTYKGAPDAALESDTVRLLQQRARSQSY